MKPMTQWRHRPSQLNLTLLRQVQCAIMENPTQFDMGTWRGDVLPGAEKCSATACLAGWAVVLGTRQRLSTLGHQDIKLLSRELLGLRTEEEANQLFFLGFWPPALAIRYISCPRTLAHYQANALVACARIEVFIDAEMREVRDEAGEE